MARKQDLRLDEKVKIVWIAKSEIEFNVSSEDFRTMSTEYVEQGLVHVTA